MLGCFGSRLERELPSSSRDDHQKSYLDVVLGSREGNAVKFG
jgi:hypothetical protein